MSARLALLGAIVSSGVLGLALESRAGPRQPARVQVTADEFRFALSRWTVRTGPVLVELLNLGEDDHDLALRRVGKGSRTFRIRRVEPGALGELAARLAPGRYEVWCTLPGHRTAGMTATLVVRRR